MSEAMKREIERQNMLALERVINSHLEATVALNKARKEKLVTGKSFHRKRKEMKRLMRNLFNEYHRSVT